MKAYSQDLRERVLQALDRGERPSAIARRLEVSRMWMPARTIEHHDDPLVRVTLTDLIEKQLHALGVDLRQDQRVDLTTDHIHRRVGVAVLVREHGLAQGAHGLGRPAAAHVVDTPKARLVLDSIVTSFIQLVPSQTDNY